MQNAGRREVDIQAIPHVAHKRSEQPLARQLHRSVECHCAQCHQHVGHGERHDEVVCDDSGKTDVKAIKIVISKKCTKKKSPGTAFFHHRQRVYLNFRFLRTANITNAFPSTAPIMMDPKMKLFMQSTLI